MKRFLLLSACFYLAACGETKTSDSPDIHISDEDLGIPTFEEVILDIDDIERSTQPIKTPLVSDVTIAHSQTSENESMHGNLNIISGQYRITFAKQVDSGTALQALKITVNESALLKQEYSCDVVSTDPTETGHAPEPVSNICRVAYTPDTSVSQFFTRSESSNGCQLTFSGTIKESNVEISLNCDNAFNDLDGALTSINVSAMVDTNTEGKEINKREIAISGSMVFNENSAIALEETEILNAVYSTENQAYRFDFIRSDNTTITVAFRGDYAVTGTYECKHSDIILTKSLKDRECYIGVFGSSSDVGTPFNITTWSSHAADHCRVDIKTGTYHTGIQSTDLFNTSYVTGLTGSVTCEGMKSVRKLSVDEAGDLTMHLNINRPLL